MLRARPGFVLERLHPASLGGRQRLYRWGHYGVSLISGPAFHAYPYAWEAAVIRFQSEDLTPYDLVYTTVLTEDVEVFESDDAADAFLDRAATVLAALTEAERRAVL